MQSNRSFTWVISIMLAVCFAFVTPGLAQGAIETGNMLTNPTFIGAEEQIPPPGWMMYGSLANGHMISAVDVEHPERRALLIEDMVDIPRGHDGEIGLQQTVAGGPGHYRVTVKIGAVADVPPDVTALQIRFLPSNELEQIRLFPEDTVGFDTFSIDGIAPEGTTHVRIYLYTFAGRMPKIRVQSITLRQITAEEVSERLMQGVIKGVEPLVFDVSRSSLNSPPTHELRSRIPEGRPRLFARPETVDDLRNKRTQSPLANLVWNNIRVRALGLQYATLPPYPPDARPGGVLEITAWRRGVEIASDIVTRLDTLGFYYLMTEDQEIGEVAKELLLHVAAWDPNGNSSRSKNDEISMRLLYTMSRAYDWLHPLLSDTEAKIVQQTMRERGNDVYLAMRQTKFEEHLLDNHLVRTMGFLGQAAIAFMGDFPEADVWFDYIVSLFLVQYPPWGGDEGGWSQGVSYWQSYVSWVLEFLDALEIATGLNLYEKPFFENTGYFKLYAHPPRSKFGAFGDHSDVPPDAGSTRVMSRLALEYRDPALQWYVDQLNHMGRVPDIPMNTFLGYVWVPLPENMPPTPEIPADLPQSRLFTDVGWALMNVDMADWDNNVHIKFKSSPYGSFNHSHAEQNSFQIEAYGSPLAIPSGYYPWYGSPHHKEWTWESRSKNTILVDGEGQRVQSIEAKGDIIKSSFGSQFDYVLGDATEAYMGRITRFWRHLLFVKPDVIVVYDQLDRMEPGTYDWLLHSLKEIQVEESAQRVRVDGDTAHMWVSFVTPEQLAFSVTDEFPILPEDREAHKPLQWHLTATAESADGTGRFLTIMVPRPNARNADAPPLVQAIPALNGHAATVEMDGTSYTIAFRDTQQDGPSDLLSAAEVETDATALVLWRDTASDSQRDEGPQGIMAVGVRTLSKDGASLLQTTEKVDVGLRWEPSSPTDDGPGRATLHVQLSGAPDRLDVTAPFVIDVVYVNGAATDTWVQEGNIIIIHVP